MSEKLCALKKIGGGTLKETTLWTNPSPTSSMSASTQPNLSDSISNYTFIKFTARVSTSDATSFSAIMSVEDFKSTENTDIRFSMATLNYVRILRYMSNTKLNISGASSVGGTSTDNTKIIITQILGMK